MNKHEVKFFNTANRMKAALMELLETQKFLDITVSDVCNKAGIHRSTFYKHYNNTVELAADLEHSLMIDFAQNNETLVNAITTKDTTTLKIDMITVKKTYTELLKYIKKYKRLFVLYDEGVFLHKEKITQIVNELLVIPTFKANGVKDETTIEYMTAFHVRGINAIISKWVKDDCRVPIEEMWKISLRCFNITFNL